MSKKTVIFDFDGTLADTLELLVKIYNKKAPEFGSRPFDISKLDYYREIGYRKAMKELDLKLHSLPRFLLVAKKDFESHINEAEPHNGIRKMLQKLRKSGYQLGILTSNDQDLVKKFVKTHNFGEFEFIVSEKNFFGKYKGLKKLIKEYQLDRKNLLYVGDEPRDVSASHRAGIAVIGVSWGIAGKSGFKHAQPDELVTSVDQLYQTILEKL